MQTRGHPLRQGFALMTWTLMLALSVLVPVLERGEILAGPVAESEHSPVTCPPAHDHTLCTHVTSHQLASPEVAVAGATSTLIVSAPRAEPDLFAGLATEDANPSRAPPFLA